MINKIAAVPFNDYISRTAPNLGAANDLGGVFNIVIGYLFPLAGFVLLFYLVTSGYSYMTSMGDPKRIEVAKTNMTYAIVGFIVIFIAYWIVILAAQILGITAITNIFK